MCLKLMNSGINTALASLELTTARGEADAQAEALRFIHNGYVAEYEYPDIDHYVAVWNEIADRAIESNDLIDTQDISRCEDIYSDAFIGSQKPFIINTRMLSSGANLDEELIDGAVITPLDAPFELTDLSPRVVFMDASDSDDELRETGVYREVASVEGIWITAVKGDVFRTTGVAKYYDMYIQTCWVAPGREYPTKIAGIVRLYNPQSELEGARP
jgi:hypothetical protein